MNDKIVTLNVGGVLHTTTRETLTRCPDSMLTAMFSGKYASPAIDLNGHYFIDRDGELFKYILNFLRTNRLCLPVEFHDFDALEAEADFFQLSEMLAALNELRDQRLRTNEKCYFVEILDFEETAYFYRFYSPAASMFGGPNSVASATTLFGANLKSGGLVVSGHVDVLRTLPISAKSAGGRVLCKNERTGAGGEYQTVTVNTAECNKMLLVHHLANHGWQLVSTAFANNTDNDGSYIVHKYVWRLAASTPLSTTSVNVNAPQVAASTATVTTTTATLATGTAVAGVQAPAVFAATVVNSTPLCSNAATPPNSVVLPFSAALQRANATPSPSHTSRVDATTWTDFDCVS